MRPTLTPHSSPPRCRIAVSLILALAAACGGGSTPGTDDGSDDGPIRVLLFTRTEGYRHASIDDAQAFFRSLPADERIDSTWTEDTAVFTDAGLAPFDVLVFANTTGDILDDPDQAAVERFVRSGRGFVGVHSAADTEYDWPWYGELVGAHFTGHPPLPITITLRNEAPTNPITAHLPESFPWTDEIYSYDRDPRAKNQILLSFAERTVWFDDANHPVSWAKEFDGGRSFYTNLGHRKASWQNPAFQQHLLQGIRFAAGHIEWNRLVLTREAENPLALAVTPDGRVIYIELGGAVRIWHPSTGRVTEAAKLDVDNRAENGLLGLALAPDFARSHEVYLYYSEASGAPPPAEGPAGWNVVARFRLGDDEKLDLASAHEILRVPSDRECCHEGGSLAFAPDGTLFISVGDNTDPFGKLGYAPLDERTGRERHDAQRTAQNPFDLRGKILRVRTDGSIPRGNLFAPSGVDGRPEVFAMGTRNPFRIAVDPKTGRLFWGDVGPDAYFDSKRGPRGYDEINFADRPGNYGWPHCIANNLPYNHFDYASNRLGESFSCAEMVPALLAYDYMTNFPEALGLGFSADEGRDGEPTVGIDGRTAIAGTVYRRPSGRAPFALPSDLEGRLVMSDWTRGTVATLQVDRRGNLQRIERLLPFETFAKPVDFEVGPDGALYVLEFGTGLLSANSDAGVSRIEYSSSGALTPVAAITASRTSGATPLSVRFSAANSRARGAHVALAEMRWDFDGDGRTDATGLEVDRAFDRNGEYPVTLTVLDDRGHTSFPTVVNVIAGNTTPTVTILEPTDGARVPANSNVTLRASASDVEEGTVDCAAIEWDIRLGHNTHSHPEQVLQGCEATLTVGSPSDHDLGIGDIFLVVEARYTDHGGAGGAPPLTGRTGIRLDFG